jgi:hypothetical protein
VRASSSGGKVTLRRSDSCGYGYGLGPAVAGPLSGDAFLSSCSDGFHLCARGSCSWRQGGPWRRRSARLEWCWI